MEESEKVALMAVGINLGIFSVKYLSASASGSIALKAEAFHTLADLVSSLSIFAGLKIAKRKTRSFPYGLYKVENVISVGIAFLIFYAGFEIVREVLTAHPVELRNSPVAILGLLVATLTTYFFSRYEKKIGRKINSPILLADAAHIHTDVLSNMVVLVAIIAGMWGYQLDKIAALVVVGFIARTGVEILRDGAKVLLDASVDHETLCKVERIIANTPQVIQLKRLTGRNSGRYTFIEADIILKSSSLEKAHSLVDTIEMLIKNEIKNVDRILIHYEPQAKEEFIYALPINDDSSISLHFGETSRFILVTFKVGEKSPSQINILDNPYQSAEKGKGISTAEFLAENGVDAVIVKKGFSSKGPSYVLANANIEVVVTDGETPEEAFAMLGMRLYQANETSNAIS